MMCRLRLRLGRAILDGEDETRITTGIGVVVAAGKFGQTVEGLAHVAGFKRKEDLEGGAAEVQYGRPPFRAR
jgi:hypothetical protein